LVEIEIHTPTHFIFEYEIGRIWKVNPPLPEPYERLSRYRLSIFQRVIVVLAH